MKVIQEKKTIVLSVKTCILPKMVHLKKVKGIDLAEYYIFVASKKWSDYADRACGLRKNG